MAGYLSLILLFSCVGLLLSLTVNYIIIRTALRPLRYIQNVVEAVQTGKQRISQSLMFDTPPDIRQLIFAINSMLDRLEQHSLQLRAISERAINAQEEERRRIARGLHDDTAQSLSMLIINLECIEQLLPADASELIQRVISARKLASATLEDLRKIVFQLRPTMLDDLGLVPAIRWYSRFHLENSGIEIRFNTPDENIRLASHIETALFRVAQEAVNNILRHAHASKATISLRKSQNDIYLIIADNGCGFNVEQTMEQAVQHKQLGLLGIRERAALVGGEFILESTPDQGTQLQVRVAI